MNSRIVLPLVMGVLVAGCGGRKNADYVPAAGLAREALDKSLVMWKTGQPPGLIEGKPGIQVVDTRRQADQVLDSYDVLGEVSDNGGRRFSVEVRLSNPAETKKIDYIVLGIDPLWVVRKEDYNVFGYWEHNMPDPSE